MLSPTSENCALDEDGNLMDASKITFFHSPSDETPLSGPAIAPASPTPTPRARPQRNSNQAKFHQALAASKLDSDDDEPSEDTVSADLAVPTTRKRKHQIPHNVDTGRPGKQKKSGPKLSKKLSPTGTANKSIAQLFLKPSELIDTSNSAVTNTNSSSVTQSFPSSHPSLVSDSFSSTSHPPSPTTECSDEALSGNADIQVSVSIKTSEAEGIKDVLTFCDELRKPKPGLSGLYKCHVCIAMQETDPETYRNLNPEFHGNVTTMRRHVAREKSLEHWRVYKQRCEERNIRVHPTATPDRVKKDKEWGILESASVRERQTTLDRFVASQWTKVGFWTRLENFIAEANVAPEVLNNAAFKELLAFQKGPKFTEEDVPSPNTAISNIKKRAKLIEDELAQRLQSAPGLLSFTYDGWTSKNMTAYFGILVHYINKDWELVSELLSFEELGGSHSGENQAEHMYNILKRYGIVGKLGYFTGDNVSVNDKTMKVLSKILAEKESIELNAVEQRTHCFEHAVNLASKAFIAALSSKTSSRQDSGAGVIIDNVKDDNEDYEEEVQVLLKEVQAAADLLPESSTEQQLLSALLLKVRGFIAKTMSNGKKIMIWVPRHWSKQFELLSLICATQQQKHTASWSFRSHQRARTRALANYKEAWKCSA